jgi:hypothetical protein
LFSKAVAWKSGALYSAPIYGYLTVMIRLG